MQSWYSILTRLTIAHGMLVKERSRMVCGASRNVQIGLFASILLGVMFLLER